MLVDGLSLRPSFLEALQKRETEVQRQFAFLRRFFTPRTVFMHLDAADCQLALEAASYVERVYALDVEQGLTRGVRLPCNLRLGIAKGPVDVAFSEELDTERLRYIHQSLVPGGKYFFYLTGDYREARRKLREAGFSEVRFPFLLSVFQRQKIAAGVK
jgi:hypothetical protein